MMKPNANYALVKESFLFPKLLQQVEDYHRAHPEAKLLHLGVGDVTLPLCPAVIEALHAAVDDQASPERFQGYQPECGTAFLRRSIAEHYRGRGIALDEDEVFISSGAADDLGALLDLFDPACAALIPEPAYPAYVDASLMAGRRVLHLPATAQNGFLPEPDARREADLIYLCSPNNPTGAVYPKELLRRWVDYANARGAILLFDAAYEAFIEDDTLPRSIFEIDGARSCAIEICSLSKTAGFTGTRLGYTVLPKELVRNGMSLHKMWVRNRTTKTNGVSYILQRGAQAVFTPEGQRQIRENIAYYKENARILRKALDRLGLWYVGGENAPYLWVRCPEGLGSWEAFARLLERCQIVTTPGIGFGACGEGYLRFSVFGSRETAQEAAERLCAI